jgi:hypothetical protein
MTEATLNENRSVHDKTVMPIQAVTAQVPSAETEATRRMMIATMSKKSMALGIILTCFFGGPGLLYASVSGGILMTLIEIIGWFFTVFTWGLGFFILIPIHLVTLTWTIIAISNHNKKLMRMI